MALNDIVVGKNMLNGKKLYLSRSGRLSHIHIIGTTGAGKSKFLEHMIREAIKSSVGLCLIDPHGSHQNSPYHQTLAYVAKMGIHPDKVVIIDPNDAEWSVGLNYLEYDPTIRSSTSHAAEVMKGIAKVFGGEDTDILPRLQRWERNALIPMIEKRLTLVELGNFVDPINPVYRKIVLQEFDHYALSDEWDRFDGSTKRDRETYVESVLNRANKFAIGNVRRIFGQEHSTIDFKQAMDDGKIILCNLSKGQMSEEEQKMIGVVLIDKILQAGLMRTDLPEEQLRPFFVYLDEFQNFVSNDIAKALQELRKFRVFFRLAHQELQQLREESSKVYSAVMNETKVKFSFRIGREDAEVMMPAMFTGKISGDEVKNTLYHQIIIPRETTRKVRTVTDSRSDGSSYAYGNSRSNSASSGTGQSVLPDQEFLDEDRLMYESSSNSNSQVSSDSESYTSTRSYGESVSEVPFVEQFVSKEISSITYYTIEEIKEKFISWIMNQEDRRAQVKIETNPPIAIETPFVEEAKVLKEYVMRLKEKSYKKYALPVASVDKMIDQRRQDFLDKAEEMGYIESKRDSSELNPQNMRQSVPNNDSSASKNSNADETIELNPQSMRQKR